MMRAVLVLAVAILALLGIAAAGAAWWLNGDAVKTRLADQVRRATGRELTVAGPVTLAWSFSPTLALNDVSLSNPPGFAQPRMAHAERIEARVGLAGLFSQRIAIDRLRLVAPIVRLERDASGRGNWVFTPPAAPPAAAPASPAGSGPRFQLSLGAVEITDASIAWGAQTLVAPRLDYDPTSHAVSGTLAANGTSLALSGTAGPFDAAPYPIDVRLAGGGAEAGLRGTSASATLTANAADLAALAPLAGRALPSVRDVALTAVLPGPGPVSLRLGATTSGRWSLTEATLTAASLGAPADLVATGAVGPLPLTLTGRLENPAALLNGASPITARLESSGLVATVTGTVAAPGTAALDLQAQVAALRDLSDRLPALTALSASGALAVRPGAVALTGLRLASGEGDLAGDLSLDWNSRPTLRGALTSQRLDLRAFAAPPASPPAVAPAAGAPPAPVPGPVRVIPDTTLPWAALRDADGDLRLSIGTLKAAGAAWTAVQAHAVLAGGTLRLDPASTGFGAATARGTLTVAAAATPPTVALTVDAPGLPFGPVLAMAGGAADATGTLDVHADLTGSGDTVRAVAASLSGQAGVALTGGQVDDALLERLAASALRAAGVSFAEGGRTAIRCAALRADATAGMVRLSALTLDTSRLALDGSGEIDLGTEALDLQLRPQLRLGGGLSVPLRVRGTLAAPKPQLDPGAFGSGRVGIVLGGPPPADACGPALAAARGGQPGAAPSPAAPPRALKPADILRGLLR